MGGTEDYCEEASHVVVGIDLELSAVTIKNFAVNDSRVNYSLFLNFF